MLIAGVQLRQRGIGVLSGNFEDLALGMNIV